MQKIILSIVFVLTIQSLTFAQTNYQLAQTLDFFKLYKAQSGDAKRVFTENDIEGSPYLNDDFILGSVFTLDKVQYEDIPLRFNIYNDNLEFKTPEDQILALSHPERVEKAVFGEYTLRYVPYYITKKKVKRGFLKLLQEGHVSLYAKADVVYQQPKEAAAYADAEPAKFLSRMDVYYLKIGNDAAQKVNSKKELLAAFPSHSDEIIRFAKKNKVKFNNVESLKILVEYYNTL